MAEILMVIAPEGFRDEEYFEVKEELEKKGHKVIVGSLKDTAVSSEEAKEVVVDVLIEEADMGDYDGLVFAGGPGTQVYFENEKVLEMCYQTIEQGKILGAICAGPGILARAGVLEGKRATAFPTEKVHLDAGGAITSDSHVVIDGQIITADGPKVAREFGVKLGELLNLDDDGDYGEEENDDGYYPIAKEEVKEVNDEGFPENKPYYEEQEKNYEKRVDEDSE
ncbi:DJ-1/PfpI family protein [Candidatus Woesearchaeota archaeon]|jgi:protease I|nr:DJ-1/PfpI family protein [Candidatus Woesearchaeota archaeon]MBT3438666.1 DJ-1/PfpI family protein [Candidatus Woesearchaeota archaeon]MBT4058594.1 DJ-1/PfpI family protein [Candidatus Woesearchaeota archaeon]MBT4207008.1 DJ-1/PfpI family protein [Candidatus Woesearchaeota archaeon]MBT4732809.1 DJ-1/PfpI family protein [Candidatus Woesearchaeota archaeon]